MQIKTTMRFFVVTRMDEINNTINAGKKKLKPSDTAGGILYNGAATLFCFYNKKLLLYCLFHFLWCSRLFRTLNIEVFII